MKGGNEEGIRENEGNGSRKESIVSKETKSRMVKRDNGSPP